MNLPPQRQDEFRTYAWNYFQFHASQRLSTFNFFVVLSVLLTSAAISTFQEKFYLPAAGAFLGLMLAALSFVFWKMDQRNQQLIKNGTDALMFLDRDTFDPAGTPETLKSPEEIHPLDLFRRDEARVRALHAQRPFAHMTYRQCMNAIFSIFGCVGLALAVAGIIVLYK